MTAVLAHEQIASIIAFRDDAPSRAPPRVQEWRLTSHHAARAVARLRTIALSSFGTRAEDKGGMSSPTADQKPLVETAVPTPSRKRRFRRPVVLGGGLALAAVALWFATRGVDGEGLGQAFGNVSWGWVAAAAIANMFTLVFQSWSWRLGLVEGGLGDVPLRHAVAATWIAKAANQVLPAKLGEVARVMVIRRHVPAGPGQIPKIVGTLVAQRIVAGLATFMIVVSAALLLPMPFAVPGGRWAPFGAVVGVVAILVGVRRIRLGRMVPARLRGLVGSFTEGAGILRPSGVVAKALGLQVAALLAQTVTVGFVLHAFGVAAPAEASLLVLAMMAIAGAVAAAPGGLGVTQFAIVAPLGALYGVGADLAFAFSIGLQGTVAAVALVGGLPALLHQRFARSSRSVAAAAA